MSLRQSGLVQTPDITATLIDLFGLEMPNNLSGTPIFAAPHTQNDPVQLRSALADQARHAAYGPRLQGLYIVIISTITVLVILGFVWSLNRRIYRKDTPSVTGLLRGWKLIFLWMTQLAATVFLANLLPWWRLGDPCTERALATTSFIGALIPLLLAFLSMPLFLLPRIVRPPGLRPAGLVGAVSAFVLAVLLADPLLGSPLLLDSALGVPTATGWRFYGVNNSSFALIVTAALVLSACIGHVLIKRGKRLAAGIVTVIIGSVCVIIDAAPSIGADLGGPLAAIPGFLIMALLLTGRRLTWLTTMPIVLVTLVSVASVAVLDWMRPLRMRTHLGNFVQNVLEGQAHSVLWRKATQIFSGSLPLPLILAFALGVSLLALLIFAPIVSAVRNPQRGDYSWLTQPSNLPSADQFSPAARPLITSWVVTMVLATAANDSSILIPLTASTLLIPLLGLAITGALSHSRNSVEPV